MVFSIFTLEDESMDSLSFVRRLIDEGGFELRVTHRRISDITMLYKDVCGVNEFVGIIEDSKLPDGTRCRELKIYEDRSMLNALINLPDLFKLRPSRIV